MDKIVIDVSFLAVVLRNVGQSRSALHFPIVLDFIEITLSFFCLPRMRVEAIVLEEEDTIKDDRHEAENELDYVEAITSEQRPAQQDTINHDLHHAECTTRQVEENIG